MGGLIKGDFWPKWAAGKNGIIGKRMRYRFAMPSFLEGLARIFDFGGTLLEDYEVPGSGFEDDIAAMRSDWIVIGQDMRDVINTYPDHKIEQ